MNLRRKLAAFFGVLLVLLGMGMVALIASEFLFSGKPADRPLWQAIAMFVVGPPVMYLGVHWIFGRAKSKPGSDRWDSNSPA
jgi:hypothetical protein